MNKIAAALLPLIALVGCQSVPVAQMSAYDLCEGFVMAKPLSIVGKDDFRKELETRGEDCQRHLPMIAARAQARGNAIAASAMVNQIMQNNRPMQARCTTNTVGGTTYTNCN
jgi:hypothetical protein